MSIDELDALLSGMSEERRRLLFDRLRREFSIHPLEDDLGMRAEMVLEAFNRADELIKRNFRGVIAEGAFAAYILPGLVESGWSDLGAPGSTPDFRLDDGRGPVGIEIKLQRSKEFEPMKASSGYVALPSDMYAVEMQRTRGGERQGKSTRPYDYTEFDILGVSMRPLTQDWGDFRFALTRCLLPETWRYPKKGDPNIILKFQPVSMESGHGWTSSIEEAVDWFHSGVSTPIESRGPAERNNGDLFS